MRENIRVVRCTPNQPREVLIINDDLETLQSLVGGYIETYTFSDGLIAIVDEEGMLKDLPLQSFRDMPFLGVIILTRVDEEGIMISLTEEETKALLSESN